MRNIEQNARFGKWHLVGRPNWGSAGPTGSILLGRRWRRAALGDRRLGQAPINGSFFWLVPKSEGVVVATHFREEERFHFLQFGSVNWIIG